MLVALSYNNSNNLLDMVVLWIDNQPGENTAYYRVERESGVDSHP